MRAGECRTTRTDDGKTLTASFGSLGHRNAREYRAVSGIVAACVALLKHGIAEIAAVKSSPRLRREEEKE